MPRGNMNRGGGFRGGNSRWQHDKFEDDNMDKRNWKPDNIKRKVHFKPTVKIHKLNDMKIRAAFDDDDEMQQDGSSSNYTMANRGRNNRGRGSIIPRSQMQNRGGKRTLIAGVAGWYHIIIPHGQKYEKEFVLKSLLNVTSPDIFIPMFFKQDPEGKSVSFYIEDYKLAEKIMNADRTIQMPDGFRMLIRVRSSIPPTNVDDALKERMKIVMAKRYNAQTKALDLTKFHTDPDLSDIFCALFRPTIMLAAINIIGENIPDLEALNLNDNKLHLLDHFKSLSQKAPNIRILYLGNNRIQSPRSLESMRGLPITEIFLDGNPFKDRIKDHDVYVSEVKKIFPKIVKLDESTLAPTIGFDISNEVQLPPAKESYLCDNAGAEIVRQFLEQYFILYDSDNRQQLLDAYHEHAMLSLTATNNQHATSAERLTTYLNCSRNLNRFRDSESRLRLLKRGRLQVVTFLSELPLTKHDPMSFAVDLTLFTPQMILLTVTGVYKERTKNPSNDFVRSFQRTLFIVPNNNGFCIRNELFHVNNASGKQERSSFKGPSLTEMSTQQQQPMPAPAIHAPPPALPNPTDSFTQMQMIQQMCQQSNMNMEWSKKCLEETNWDYTRAVYVFTELHKQNKIPPEAFVK